MSFPACKKQLRLLPLLILAMPSVSTSYGQTALKAQPENARMGSIAPPTGIKLDPPVGADVRGQLESSEGKPLPKAPDNFRHLGDAKVGELSELHTVTLRFTEATKLTHIQSNDEFAVEQGSSCVEGNSYKADSTCTLLVRFSPKGAGHRIGHVKIDHTASITPFYVGLGGNGYAPVASFTPAQITTVPATFPGDKGLLINANSLSVDGGDTLYVADTGNNVIRAMDSSGVIKTVSSGTLSSPYAVVADNFGEVFFDEPAQNAVFEIFDYGSQFQLGGVGTDNCTTTTTCSINSEKIYLPGQMSIDPNNQIFMVEQLRGAMVAYAEPYPAQIARLYDPFTFQNLNQGTVAVDAYDNIYSLWSITNVCQILSEYFSDAANSHQVYKKIAGGKNCGFAGDGGPARNAEIGAVVPQMAFDVAGNLYFTDSSNQRVRRIDASTGIINTIAGTAVAGYGGDGGQATSAALSSPSGIGVGSMGQVYVISKTAATGTAQVVRKIGPNGYLAMGNQARGTLSATKTVTLSNTGNSTLTFANVSIIGGNASEFAIVPSATSCNLTAGGSLANGQSCVIGISFRPAAAGTRVATLNFMDNSLTNTDTVTLNGYGTLPTPTFAIATPASGATYTAGATVPFKVTVTSTTTPAPTGTVTFTVDGATYGSPITIASGAASVNLTGLTTKAHALGAKYSGDANYSAVGPITENITVVAAAKTAAAVKLVSAANPTTSCKQVGFSVAVSSTAGGTPTGIVQLKEGTKVLAQGSLVKGAVLISVTSLTPGTHALTATYVGDTLHTAANSSALQQSVTGLTTCNVAKPGPIRSIGRPGSALRGVSGGR